MSRPKVIHAHEIWPVSILILYSSLAGILSYIGVLCVIVIDVQLPGLSTFLVRSPIALVALMTMMALAAPSVLLWRYQSMILTAKRSAISGIGCAIGANSLLAFFSLGNPDIRHWLSIALSLVVTSVLYGAINLALMYLFRKIRPPIVIQDGLTCPNCAYCLLGNTSMTCPECGRIYTFLELGTSREEFLNKSKAAAADKAAEHQT